MNKGIWMSGFVLAFGGWASTLFAQDVAWRPAARPDTQPTKVAVTPSGPGAYLGRPIALELSVSDDAASPDTRAPAGLIRASYNTPAVPPPIARAQNPELVANSIYYQAEPQDEDGVAGFALDRVVPAIWRGGDGQSRVIRTSANIAANPIAQPFADSTDAACFATEGTGPGTRFYLNAEYLLWWTKSDRTPPLVTTSNPADFGFVGNPSTQTLFGGNLDRNPYQGARVTAGYFLDSCGKTAIEVSGFILGQESARFMANSAQYPVIARPFFNLNQGIEFSQLVAFPGVSTGNVQIKAPSRLWGAEANLRCNLCSGCNYKVDVLGGFRYLDLNESIQIQENIQGLAGAPAPFTNAITSVSDRFATHNQFYGGQIGFDSQYHYGKWSLDLLGKLALGNTHQSLTIDGSERIVASNGTVSNFNGGLLALPSNIGHFSRDRFSIAPEVGLNLGYQVTEHVRFSVGYNFLYWTNVLRPGDQIDRVLDVTQIPNFNNTGLKPTGQNRPLVPFKESDFWAHGLNVGVEFRY